METPLQLLDPEVVADAAVRSGWLTGEQFDEWVVAERMVGEAAPVAPVARPR